MRSDNIHIERIIIFVVTKQFTEQLSRLYYIARIEMPKWHFKRRRKWKCKFCGRVIYRSIGYRREANPYEWIGTWLWQAFSLNWTESWEMASVPPCGRVAMGEGFAARGKIVDSGQMDDRFVSSDVFHWPVSASSSRLPRKPIVKTGSLYGLFSILFQRLLFQESACKFVPELRYCREHVSISVRLAKHLNSFDIADICIWQQFKCKGNVMNVPRRMM